MKIIRYIFIRHFYHISFIFNLTNHYFRSILYLLAELIYFDTVMKFHHRVKIIARRKTLIDEVFVDMGDNLNNECVMQLMVTQHERFSEQKNK